MAIREVLKMGDPRLLETAQVVTDFSSPELAQLLIDMGDTMQAMNGAAPATVDAFCPIATYTQMTPVPF